MRGGIAVLAALALLCSGEARAACIDEPVTTAARLHEFEMMMMDVSLRCTRLGIAMQADFDGMVTAHRSLFDEASVRLRRFFGEGVDGPHHGSAYDRYATLLANRYGGGNTSLDACRVFDGVAAEVAKAGDSGRMLGAVARAMIEHPLLERATCSPAP